jgi:hypothetical protein
MRRLALLLVAACGTTPDATTPQTLVFDPYSVPQYTSHDVFVGGSGDVVVMTGHISRDRGATWAPLDPQLGSPTRVAILGTTVMTWTPSRGLVRWDLATGAVTALAGQPVFTGERSWRMDPVTGRALVFDAVNNAIAIEGASGFATSALPQPTSTETMPYIHDLESNGTTLMTVSAWGVHRSRDGGATWQLVTDDLANAGRDLLVLADGRFVLFGGMTSYLFDATGAPAGTRPGVIADEGDASACADGALVVHDQRSTDLGATWHPLIASGDLTMIVERIACAGDRYWMLARSDSWGYRLVSFTAGAAQLAAGNWETAAPAWAPGGPPVTRTGDGTFLVAGLAWRDGDPSWALRVLPPRAWAANAMVFGSANDTFYASLDAGATWRTATGTGPAADQADSFARTADGSILVSTWTGSGDATMDHWHAEVWRSTDAGASWTSVYRGDASRPAGGDVTGEAHRFVGVTADGTWVATDAVSHDAGATWLPTEVHNDHSLAFLTPGGRLVAELPTGDPTTDVWRVFERGGEGGLSSTYQLEIAGTPVAASALQSVAFDDEGYAYVAGGAPYVQLWKSEEPLDPQQP